MARAWTVSALMLLAGCGGPPAPPPVGDATPDPAFPVTVTDGLGRSVAVARRPERIVSLAPAVTEMLFAVGAGPRVVAVTTTDSYPPEVNQLPAIGGFSPKTISTEKILALRPDLVVAAGRLQQPVVEALEKLGLTVIAPEPATFEEVIGSIEQVGRVTGCEGQAARVAAGFRTRLAAVRGRVAAVAEKDRPKVLYVLWDDPLQTAGPGAFVGQLIAEAGGVNVFADSTQQYPRVSDEAVLQRQPDLIIAPDHGRAGLPDRLGRRPGWETLAAVKEGRIRTVNEDLVNRPGPRLIDGLEAVEKLVRHER